ncbi:MAG TPA: tetratricopeptide repeat protein [Steroidobacteraceae bacterium]|jgi:serine/threonine protein kinase/TolA-binding protein
MTLQGTGKLDVRLERLQELFFFASELQGSERESFIANATEAEPELRQELLGLLSNASRNFTSPLTHALGRALANAEADKRNALIGRTIGNYKLVSVLGRGGAGVVYLGERADRQYSAQVAIKVVDHTAVADLGARFRSERQILASLNHPNIARLVDAGETEDGQPYLVMDYVHGEPLDRYCDSRKLDFRARLTLFLEICGAVQYAHQNLIVHRDIKPANILVTADGVPKLLDFGIAKLLNAGDVVHTPDLTRMNDRVLTPEYASPEQILGQTVTTSSDVYSLGVLLYQLLTGLRPYTVPASGSQLEIERSICVIDPPRPSAIVQRAMQSPPVEDESTIEAIALARGQSPERLQRRLIGDIDSIVMRALRKEPEHRYSSVERLVEDIRHHLQNEPVQARQGNWVYYSQRFVRRHTPGVIAGVGFLAFVIAVAVVMSIQRQDIARALDRATQDRERAEKVSDFMLTVFTAADPFTNFGREPTARTLLDQAARHISSDLDEQPDVHARLLEAIGRSFRRMGQPDRAVAYLQDSLRVRQQAPGNDEAAVGSIVTEIAIALRQAGRTDESDRYFTEALEISRHAKDQRSVAHAQLLVDLGRLEKMRSNTKQALEHLTVALQLMREIKGPRDPEVGAILAEMSNILVWSDDLPGAERAAREAVSIYEVLPKTHPDRVMADYYLADILFYRGRINDAAALFERALDAQRTLYGNANSTVADTLASLAQVRLAQNNPADAEKLIREAITIHKDSGSTAYQRIGYLQTMLATVYMRQKKFTNAEAQLRETLDLFEKHLPPDHQYRASAEHYLGETLLAIGKLKEAETVLTTAMNRWTRTGASAWRSARSASALGEVLYREGRIEEAESYLSQSYRELSADPGADGDSKRIARERVEKFYTERGQRPKLDALMLEVERASAAATVDPNATAAPVPATHSR